MEVTTNIFGKEIHFYQPQPSDNAQNYNLKSKYLTIECLTCPAFIAKKQSLAIIDKARSITTHKWTPPNEKSVQGICSAGEYLKVLENRPRGKIHCGIKSKPQQF